MAKYLSLALSFFFLFSSLGLAQENICGSGCSASRDGEKEWCTSTPERIEQCYVTKCESTSTGVTYMCADVDDDAEVRSAECGASTRRRGAVPACASNETLASESCAGLGLSYCETTPCALYTCTQRPSASPTPTMTPTPSLIISPVARFLDF